MPSPATPDERQPPAEFQPDSPTPEGADPVGAGRPVERIEEPLESSPLSEASEASENSKGSGVWSAWLIALLVVAFSATARIWGTLNDPNFDREEVAGLLRSDPGLLYYITERILESDGGVPDDFHANRHVQTPDEVDLARMFTVGQEFLVAWAYRAFGGDMPLHMFCVVFFSILASLTALGIFGAAYELTTRWRWAALAALLYASLPINFRTTGFILIREDLSIPLFSMHMWSLARLSRRPTLLVALLSGLALSAALATWHAMGFVVALEVAAITGTYLLLGANPFNRLAGWVLFGTVLATSQLVPVLRAKGFLLSLPVVLTATLAAMATFAALRPKRSVSAQRGHLLERSAWWAATLALLYATSATLGETFFDSAGDYDHVVALMLAKLKYFGTPPVDPTLLSTDVRLLWQGPFATASWMDFAFGLPHAILGGLFALVVLLRSRPARSDLVTTLGFLLLGCLAGWLVRRTLILPGMLAPVAIVVAFERIGRRKLGTVLLPIVSLAGMGFLLFSLTGAPIGWYAPGERVQEIRRLTRWVSKNLPENATVLGDFGASTSLLAACRTRIALQPKYETALTRQRIEDFYTTFVAGTPTDMHALAERLGCEYLLIDTEMLWVTGRYTCGVPMAQTVPTQGTCAYAFVNQNPAALTSIPGFKLLYRSPPDLGMDKFRLFRLTTLP